MTHKENKFKGMSKREAERQQKYDNYEKCCQGSPREILRQKPYALIYAEKLKELRKNE